jgi:hypothetical protein
LLDHRPLEDRRDDLQSSAAAVRAGGEAVKGQTSAGAHPLPVRPQQRKIMARFHYARQKSEAKCNK